MIHGALQPAPQKYLETSPPQSRLGRAHRCCTTMKPSPHWLQWNTSNSPQNCPFPFDNHHHHLIHPSLDQPHSPSQTASGSNQLFCHSTLSGQTDRPTDRWARQQVSKISTYACNIDRQQCAKKDSNNIGILLHQVIHTHSQTYTRHKTDDKLITWETDD